MKTMVMIVIFLAYSIFKILYAQSAEGQPEIVFPTLDTPSFDFIDLSGGCGGFTDCLEYIGAVIYNIGLGIIFLVLFIVDLIVYIFELFTLLLQVTFTGIEGAPWWINAIPVTYFAGVVALTIYRIIRSGESAD